MGERPFKLRSFMFLPALNRKFIDKALSGDADAIILDMEDSVPPVKRAEARSVIRDYAENGRLAGKKVFVRINHMGTEDFVHDIAELLLPGIDGLMPSKIDSAEDIVFLDRLAGFWEIRNGLEQGSILLAPLIETTAAVSSLREIACASRRLVALCLGGEDYLNDLGTTFVYQETALVYARALLVNEARKNGLLPIDTPYLNIGDTEGFERNERLAYKNGFAGCLLINPRQIASANKVFSPDEEQIDFARKVIAAVEQAGEKAAGVAMLDGAMVGPPMRKRADNILRQAGEETAK